MRYVSENAIDSSQSNNVIFVKLKNDMMFEFRKTRTKNKNIDRECKIICIH